jgi:II/X family phage/plasmid replication protein
MAIPVFCDWAKLRFAVNKPPIGTNYALAQYNRDIGLDAQDWERNAWIKHIKKPEFVDELIGTSASSSVQLRYDAQSGFLDVDGNLGKWGRSNNVWNYGVYGSVWRFLPSILVGGVQIVGDMRLKRIDLTANVSFKSASDAYAYLRWAGMRKIARLNPKPYLTGVMWVTENYSLKIYDKLVDLSRNKMKLLSEKINSEFGYVLRFEITLRSDELKKYGMEYLHCWQNKDFKMSEIFEDKFKPLLRNDALTDNVTDEMPTRLASAVDSWRSGRNYLAMVADGRINIRTYQRLRKDLLIYGFDISQPCNVTALNIRPREIEFSFIDAPAWYWRNQA